MIEPLGLGSKTGFNVTQAFSVGELGESHTAKLFCAEKGFDLVVAVITVHAFVEGTPWKVVHDLRENQFSC